MAILVREALKEYHNSDIDTRLDLDSAVNHLYNIEELDDTDIKIIEYTKLQYSTLDIGVRLDINHSTVSRRLNKAGSKIAKHLGIMYQDFKIILHVEKRIKRKLTDDELKVCWYIINHFGNVDNNLSIFNFRILKDGKIVANDENSSVGRLSQQI